MISNFVLMLIGFASYAATLVVSQKLLGSGVDSVAVRTVVSLAPMLPAIFICGVIIRNIANLDELQRKVQLEALALAFAGTALITFGYGFLEGTGLPRLSMFAVWPLMASLWLAGVIFGNVRYR
ncbi:hypothetical protein [Hoeflea sp.]|uniref:hypothetical protein n=1 Tax=Hoeflea sp. TaxID=1940281 RepID=UPI00374956AE